MLISEVSENSLCFFNMKTHFLEKKFLNGTLFKQQNTKQFLSN